MITEIKEIKELEETKEQKLYIQAKERYQNTVDKIYIAWDRAGFSGDPLHDLYVSLWELSMLTQNPNVRGGRPPRPRR